MASVHLGRLVGDEGFSRIVAIKQLLPAYGHDPAFVEMFLDEARLLSRIHHPHVVAPLDIVKLESELFIVMQYVHGETAANLLRASGRALPPHIAASIMVQVLLGLHAAHEATDERGDPLHIVHRDVSPQNILVGVDGSAKVLDFGIAKAVSRCQTTQDGQLKGKLGYFAPEQLELRPIDRRTDLFTAGVVLWELLTGERMFAVESIAALAHLVVNAQIVLPSAVNPDLPDGVDELMKRALARAPELRFQTAQDMADALGHTLPTASALELGAWVRNVAGEELAKRGERVAELERLSPSELSRTLVSAAGHPSIEAGPELATVAPAERDANEDPSSPPLATSVASIGPVVVVRRPSSQLFAGVALGAVLVALGLAVRAAAIDASSAAPVSAPTHAGRATFGVAAPPQHLQSQTAPSTPLIASTPDASSAPSDGARPSASAKRASAPARVRVKPRSAELPSQAPSADTPPLSSAQLERARLMEAIRREP